jgi:outer membrane protein OmpA-like peptidoglycan-associated protein
MRKVLLFLFITSTLSSIGQNSFCLKGIVRDTEIHKPMPGVTLFLKGDDYSDVPKNTDKDGYYFYDSSMVKPNDIYRVFAVYNDYYQYTYEQEVITKGIAPKVFECNIGMRKCPGSCGDCVMHFQTINFDSGSSWLSNNFKDSLQLMKCMMIENPTIVIEADGHASRNEGSNKRKENLALERANNCKAFLMSKGIDSARIMVKGWADSKPSYGYDIVNISHMRRKSERDSAYAANQRVAFRILAFNYQPR